MSYNKFLRNLLVASALLSITGSAFADEPIQCPEGSTGIYPDCTCTDNTKLYNRGKNECLSCPEDSTLENGTCVCKQAKFFEGESNEVELPNSKKYNPENNSCDCNTDVYYCKNGEPTSCKIGKDSNGTKFNGVYVFNKGDYPQPSNIALLAGMKKVEKNAKWCKPYIYKCNDGEKISYYSNEPCKEGDTPIALSVTEIKNINSVQEYCDGLDNNLDGKKDNTPLKGSLYGIGVSLPKKFDETTYSATVYTPKGKETTEYNTSNVCKLSFDINGQEGAKCVSAKYGALKCTKDSKLEKKLECSAKVPKGKTEVCSKTPTDFNCDGQLNNIKYKKCKPISGKGKVDTRCNPRGVLSCNGKKEVCTEYKENIIFTDPNTGKLSVISDQPKINIPLSDQYKGENKGVKPNVANAKTEDGKTLAEGSNSPIVPCWEKTENGITYSCASVNKEDCKDYVDSNNFINYKDDEAYKNYKDYEEKKNIKIRFYPNIQYGSEKYYDYLNNKFDEWVKLGRNYSENNKKFFETAAKTPNIQVQTYTCEDYYNHCKNKISTFYFAAYCNEFLDSEEAITKCGPLFWFPNSNERSCNKQYYSGQKFEKGWICNGRDDNCNGKIDENINFGKPCRTKVNGEMIYGTFKCVKGKKACIVNPEDIEESAMSIASLSNDQCPDNPYKSRAEKAEDCGTPLSSLDSDGDGVADYLDECPNNPFKTKLAEDSICGPVEDKEADTDKDGVPDYLDGCVYNSNKSDYVYPFACGNEYDQTDSDGDGVIDAVDECPTDRNKSEEGVCGCNDEDLDIDDNGVMDCMQFQGGEEHYFDVNDTPRTPYLKLANNTLRIRMENVVPAYESSDEAVIRYEVNIVNEVNGSVKASRKIVKKPFAKVKNAKGVYSISYRVISRDGGNTTNGEWSNVKIIAVNE